MKKRFRNEVVACRAQIYAMSRGCCIDDHTAVLKCCYPWVVDEEVGVVATCITSWYSDAIDCIEQDDQC